MSSISMVQKGRDIPQEVKNWVIKRLKKGASPVGLTEDLKRIYGISVTRKTIHKWRHQHIRTTGKYVPYYREFHKIGKYKGVEGRA